MRHLDYKFLAFALMLICLLCILPAPARQADAGLSMEGQMIELNISASGSSFAEHPVKVQVREGEMSTLKLHEPGHLYYQYMVRAYRPTAEHLRPAARRIVSPLAMSIRIDTSEDGKTWRLQTHANLVATIGTTVAAEISGMDTSTSLIVSSRLMPPSEH